MRKESVVISMALFRSLAGGGGGWAVNRKIGHFETRGKYGVGAATGVPMIVNPISMSL